MKDENDIMFTHVLHMISAEENAKLQIIPRIENILSSLLIDFERR